MSPLVAILLFGFMFVIALSLTLWAALTLGDGRRPDDDEPSAVAYVPFGAERPVWRREENSEPRVVGFERRANPQPERRTGLPPLPERTPTVAARRDQDDRPALGRPDEANDIPVQTNLKNDDFRGARATVTQRPNHDDAFERFLENDRD